MTEKPSHEEVLAAGKALHDKIEKEALMRESEEWILRNKSLLEQRDLLARALPLLLAGSERDYSLDPETIKLCMEISMHLRDSEWLLRKQKQIEEP